MTNFNSSVANSIGYGITAATGNNTLGSIAENYANGQTMGEATGNAFGDFAMNTLGVAFSGTPVGGFVNAVNSLDNAIESFSTTSSPRSAFGSLSNSSATTQDYKSAAATTMGTLSNFAALSSINPALGLAYGAVAMTDTIAGTHIGQSISETLGEVTDAIGDTIGGALGSVGEAIGDAVGAVGEAIGSAVDAVGSAIGSAVGSVADALGGSTTSSSTSTSADSKSSSSSSSSSASSSSGTGGASGTGSSGDKGGASGAGSSGGAGGSGGSSGAGGAGGSDNDGGKGGKGGGGEGGKD